MVATSGAKAAGHWLVGSGGLRLRIGPGGVLVGRSPECHLCLPDRRASRYHALIRADGAGLRLFVLGSNPVRVGDEWVKVATDLEPGSTVGFPGEDVRVEGENQAVAVWVLELPDGRSLLAPSDTFVVGPDDDADIVLPTWTEHARFDHAQGGLLATLTPNTSVDGVPIPVRQMVRVDHGARLGQGGTELTFLRELKGDGHTTQIWVQRPVADHVALEPLRSGASLEVVFADLEATVRLSELRARLLRCLLAPAAPKRPGDFVDEAWIATEVWPGRPEKGARDVEQLVHKLRSDLVEQGIDPFRLLGHRAGGGALRVLVGPATTVVVS